MADSGAKKQQSRKQWVKVQGQNSTTRSQGSQSSGGKGQVGATQGHCSKQGVKVQAQNNNAKSQKPSANSKSKTGTTPVYHGQPVRGVTALNTFQPGGQAGAALFGTGPVFGFGQMYHHQTNNFGAVTGLQRIGPTWPTNSGIQIQNQQQLTNEHRASPQRIPKCPNQPQGGLKAASDAAGKNASKSRQGRGNDKGIRPINVPKQMASASPTPTPRMMNMQGVAVGRTNALAPVGGQEKHKPSSGGYRRGNGVRNRRGGRVGAVRKVGQSESSNEGAMKVKENNENKSRVTRNSGVRQRCTVTGRGRGRRRTGPDVQTALSTLASTIAFGLASPMLSSLKEIMKNVLFDQEQPNATTRDHDKSKENMSQVSDKADFPRVNSKPTDSSLDKNPFASSTRIDDVVETGVNHGKLETDIAGQKYATAMNTGRGVQGLGRMACKQQRHYRGAKGLRNGYRGKRATSSAVNSMMPLNSMKAPEYIGDNSDAVSEASECCTSQTNDSEIGNWVDEEDEEEVMNSEMPTNVTWVSVKPLAQRNMNFRGQRGGRRGRRAVNKTRLDTVEASQIVSELMNLKLEKFNDKSEEVNQLSNDQAYHEDLQSRKDDVYYVKQVSTGSAGASGRAGHSTAGVNAEPPYDVDENVVIDYLVNQNSEHCMFYDIRNNSGIFPCVLSPETVLESLRNCRNIRILVNPLDVDDSVVKVCIKGLRLCTVYRPPKGCNRPLCKYLHLCKDFVSESCFLKKCSFDHDVESEYNNRILSECGVQMFSADQKLHLIRSSNLLVCKEHNSSGTCPDPAMCFKLHICNAFVRNACQLPGSDCLEGHDIFSERNRRILQLYGVLNFKQEVLLKMIVGFPLRPPDGVRSCPAKRPLSTSNKPIKQINMNTEEPVKINCQREKFQTERQAMPVNANIEEPVKINRQREKFQTDRQATQVNEDIEEPVEINCQREKFQTERQAMPVNANIEEPVKINHKPEKFQTDRQTTEKLDNFAVVDSHQMAKDFWFEDRGDLHNFSDVKGGADMKKENKSYESFECDLAEKCDNSNEPSAPFVWRVKFDGKWMELVNSKSIEEEFSNPASEKVLGATIDAAICIDFASMSSDRGAVQRLSSSKDVTRWQWYWWEPPGKWIPFGLHNRLMSQDVLEAKFLFDPKHVCFLEAENCNYELNFDRMELQHINANFCRKIRRRPLYKDLETASDQRFDIDDLPMGWAPMNTKDKGRTQMVLIRPEEDSYQAVRQHFFATLKEEHYSLERICRIQNLELWTKYQRKKEEMKKYNQTLKELHVFHGTPEAEAVQMICRHGFDQRMHGKHGSQFGRGLYFASTANYSNCYTKPSNRGLRHMFYTKICVGKMSIGRSDHASLPANHGPDLGDIHVDNLRNPNVYVVSDNNQCYPEFLIEYWDKTSSPLETTGLYPSQGWPGVMPSFPGPPSTYPPPAFASAPSQATHPHSFASPQMSSNFSTSPPYSLPSSVPPHFSYQSPSANQPAGFGQVYQINPSYQHEDHGMSDRSGSKPDCIVM